jgi:hypothetical protein
MIDDFNAGAVSGTAPIDVTTTAESSHIIGGTRQLGVGENNPFLPHSSVSLVPGNGFLDYDRQQNGSFQLGYLAAASTPPMNVDLTVGGGNRFAITLSQVPGSFSITVGVRDNTFFQTSYPFTIEGSGPGTYYMDFSSFTGVDFTSIGSIALTLGGGSGPGNYRFSGFQVVPEPPGGAIVVGFALFGFAAVRFCRRSPQQRCATEVAP